MSNGDPKTSPTSAISSGVSLQPMLPGTEVIAAENAVDRTPSPAAGDAAPAASTRLPSLESLGPRFTEFVEGLQRPVIFFDTETTGTDPNNDRIIEISLVRVGPPPMGVEAPRTWRINPNARIPIEASRIHGITNEDVANAPVFAEVASELLELVQGADLAGFNMCRFDLKILQCELKRAGLDLDTSSMALLDSQVIFHKREPRTLAAAVRFYRDRELIDAHGAEADTIATLEVFAGQLERYPDLGTDLAALHELSNSNNDAFCDGGRRFVWRDDEPMFNFGKLRGKALRWVAADPDERGYLFWMIDGDFEEDTKVIVREALGGKIRRREVASASPAR